MNQPEAIIYLLHGSTGEYSDRTDWVVRGYVDKATADLDCSNANTQAAQYFNTCDRYPSYEEEISRDKALRDEILLVDPEAQFDYTGSTYWVTECGLV